MVVNWQNISFELVKELLKIIKISEFSHHDCFLQESTMGKSLLRLYFLTG